MNRKPFFISALTGPYSTFGGCRDIRICCAFSKCVVFFLQVPVAPVEPIRPDHLLPSVDHSTSFNAVTRSMVALMTVLLWQATLVAPVVFPRVLSFLLEVTLANPEKMWWKAGKCSAHYSHLVVVQSLMKPCILVECSQVIWAPSFSVRRHVDSSTPTCTFCSNVEQL